MIGNTHTHTLKEFKFTDQRDHAGVVEGNGLLEIGTEERVHQPTLLIQGDNWSCGDIYIYI